jgi:altronate dehydratase
VLNDQIDIGMFEQFRRFHPLDNVAVRLSQGEDPWAMIPVGHKIALVDMKAGDPVIKYGQTIGEATREIREYEHVHTHNVAMPPNPKYTSHQSPGVGTDFSKWNVPRTFNGYLRSDGRAGIRNYFLLVSSVNCSATVVKTVARHFLNRKLPAGLDGVIPVVHMQGCAQAIGGYGYNILNRTLAGWMSNPNVVGSLVIELGCEQTNLESITASSAQPRAPQIPIERLSIQDVGGTNNAIKASIEKVESILESMQVAKRTELPVSYLNLALNCGASDAFSGLTANPALGMVSDFIVANGGTSALAEIPECHGTEDILFARCRTNEERAKLEKTFAWWSHYTELHQAEMNNNLALGNIEGGITTIVEKSLGAVSKSGFSQISRVVDFAEPTQGHGLVLMNTPGFDPVSVTGLVAGGCNIVAFTTGRGSTYGCSIAPTIKISSNSAVFKKMSGDIDVDAGRMLSGVSQEEVAIDIYREVIAVANGKQTSSESLGLGWEEFAPWQVGETL